MVKLYLRLFDDWSFENIYYCKHKALESCSYSIQTIKEIEVCGDVVDDTVFIVLDGYYEVYGVFLSLNEAETVDIKDTYIKKIKIE